MEQQKMQIRQYYNDQQINKEEYLIYTSILDTYEHLLPPVVKGSLALAAVDLAITGLLFAGLVTRNAGLMLPWLAASMLYLSVLAAFVLGLTVIQFAF